jgi:hypothetical protein
VKDAIADIDEVACAEGGELKESERGFIFEGVIDPLAFINSCLGAAFNGTFRRRAEPALLLLTLELLSVTKRFVELKETLRRSKYPGSRVSSLGKV